MLKRIALAITAIGMTVASALAHATLELGSAPAGSYYKAVLRIPHGCAGKPTNVVRVRVAARLLRREADARRASVRRLPGCYQTVTRIAVYSVDRSA